MTVGPSPRSDDWLPGERERFGYGEPSGAPFLRGVLVAALALSTALFLAALSTRQLSQRDTAMPLLEASLEALTEPEPLVEMYLDAMRERANGDVDAILVPGYPLDVALAPAEVRTMEAPELSDLLLARSAALVYGQGMDTLDQSGNQDTSRFSAQGVVYRISERLSKDSHDTATTATVFFLLLTAALAVVVVLVYREERRVLAMGIGLLLGGLSVLIVAVALGWAAGRWGGSDPFVQDVREIVRTILDVPRRNALIVVGLGLLMVVTSIVMRLVPEGGEDYGFVPGEDDFGRSDEE